MSNFSEPPIIVEPKSKHEYSLIWLHGLGDSGKGFEPVFTNPMLKVVPSTCRVILPSAPKRKVTCNGGAVMTSWYDILSLGTGNTSTNQFSQPEIQDSIRLVTGLIDGEKAKLGSAQRVFIGGFS